MEYSGELIGKRIKEQRDKLNWSQEGLGKALGQRSGAKQISKYESGVVPPMNVLFQLCKIFNCELGYLLGEEEYRLGTKFDSMISSELGLNADSIEVIKNLCEYEKLDIDNDIYKKILNDFISCSHFKLLMEDLFDLENEYIRYNNIQEKIKQNYSNEVLDKAYLYFQDPNIFDESTDNEESLKSAIEEITSTEEVIDIISLNMKVYRYEAREKFERLLDKIFPKIP